MLKDTVQTLSALTAPEDGDKGATYLIGDMVKNGFEIWKIQGSNPASPSSAYMILGEFINLSESCLHN